MRDPDRLDPVRWRRPGRGALLRSALIAALLATAAVVMWSGPQQPLPVPATTAPPPSMAQGPTPSAATVPPGLVGVPIRLADPTALRLISPGDHVDLFAVTDDGSTAIAAAALVLEITGADDPTAGGLLLALRPDAAQRTMTSTDQGYAVLVRPD